MKRRIASVILLCVFFTGLGLSQDVPSIPPVQGKISSGMSGPLASRTRPEMQMIKHLDGVDFQVPVGTPVCATATGMVTRAGASGPDGLSVRIDHGRGIETFYAHLSKVSVAEGMRVRKGQVLGYSGNSGLSSTPHVHYEIIKDGRSIDPQPYLSHLLKP